MNGSVDVLKKLKRPILFKMTITVTKTNTLIN